MKKITLVCAAGMSTSLLVSKMNLAAMRQELDVKIQAVPESEFPKHAAETDVLLLGPQVGYLLNAFKSKYAAGGMKIAVINSIDYGMMDGDKVLKMAMGM